MNAKIIIVVLSLCLVSCAIQKNKCCVQEERRYYFSNEYICIYLQLNANNTFCYQKFGDILRQKTEGIYIEEKDSLLLYTTKYSFDYFNSILEDCENARFAPHFEDLLFERKKISKKSNSEILIDNVSLIIINAKDSFRGCIPE